MVSFLFDRDILMKELKELFVKVPLKNLEGTLDNSFSNYISVAVLPFEV